MKSIQAEDVRTIITRQYGIIPDVVKDLSVPVNDVFEVISSQGHFALKLYNVRSRNRSNVQWELDLLQRLVEHGAPVAAAVPGKDGYLQSVNLNNEHRVAVLFDWAPGAKPQPSRSTYLMLGEAAGRIHHAAVGFSSVHPRERYDLENLIDLQLERMRSVLEEIGQWTRVRVLGDRLCDRVQRLSLDTGVCHMDLT